MRSRHLALVTALATSLALTAPAHAHEVSAVADIDLGFGFGDSALLGSVTGFTPNLSLYLPFAPNSGLVLQWGLTYAWGDATAPLASSGVALQNPFLGYRFALADDVWFTPGVTIPVASIPDGANDRPAVTVASNMGRGTFGLRELWRYVPENVSIVAPVGGSLPLDDDMRLTYEAALALAIPTSDADRDIDLIVDLGITWVYQFVSLGLGAVWIPTNSNDNLQFSLRPAVRVPIGSAVLHAGVTLNLGGTFDSFGDGGVIGADLGVQFHF